MAGQQAVNLLQRSWIDRNLDSHELRLLLDARIGGPGQYERRSENPDTLYLPLAGPHCKVALTFKGTKIETIEPGPAFDRDEWVRVGAEIERSILAGPQKVGREVGFSSFRVLGSWRGDQSGVQILPPPEGAALPPVELAEHPFILEFPIQVSDLWRITNHRRQRESRNLTWLLNVLLAGRTSFQPKHPQHFWAVVTRDGDHEYQWVQQFYLLSFGEAVRDELSPPAAERLEEVDSEEYYTKVGHDGRGLRVPTDLDQSICCYKSLSARQREKFERALFWFDLASRQWHLSVSASFASLVSAIESLTGRGTAHQFKCPKCGGDARHETPGAAQKFRDFFESYAPGASLAERRRKMYSIRSSVLHGDKLMLIDQDLDFGWDPPGWNEHELRDELWRLTRLALRNWLGKPPTA